MRHLINAIEESLESDNWYAALTLTLTLPDICGKISFDHISGKQRYAEWFTKYVGDKYTPLLSGEDCYALRCAFLHEGTAFTGNQKAKKSIENFIFVASNSTKLHLNILAGSLQLDVVTFCKDICIGVREWMRNSHPSIFMPNVLNIVLIQEGDEIRLGANGIEVIQPDGRERWGLAHQTDPSNVISLEEGSFYDKICDLLKPAMVLHNIAAITPFKSGAYIGYSQKENSIYTALDLLDLRKIISIV